jgi:hypothetical protein
MFPTRTERIANTSRTCYPHIHRHHFWYHVSKNNWKDGKVVVAKVDTMEQRGDYFTKGLPRESFERCCTSVQGW